MADHKYENRAMQKASDEGKEIRVSSSCGHGSFALEKANRKAMILALDIAPGMLFFARPCSIGFTNERIQDLRRQDDPLSEEYAEVWHAVQEAGFDLINNPVKGSA